MSSGIFKKNNKQLILIQHFVRKMQREFKRTYMDTLFVFLLASEAFFKTSETIS